MCTTKDDASHTDSDFLKHNLALIYKTFWLWCLLQNYLQAHWINSTVFGILRLGTFHGSQLNWLGAGIAQWLEHWTRDRKVAGSNPCRSGGRIFFSRVSFLCWLLFRYPFHPNVTAVTRKRPRSFCQKCRWQVTAKHAYTLCMWLCMKWHGCMVYTERTQMAAISCGTSHASAVSTPLRWIFNNNNKSAIKSYSLM